LKYYARIGERTIACSIEEAEDGAIVVAVDGRRYRADLRHIPASHAYSLLLDGRSYEFTLHENDEGIELAGAAGLFTIAVEDARTHAARTKTQASRGAAGPRVVKAVMPGIVREVAVAAGDAVAKGQPLLILEAMKMQNEIRADAAGRVRRLFVVAGDTVEKGARLAEIE
jgi:biotin carboxyl carrier protein